jgi:hypothetical protein
LVCLPVYPAGPGSFSSPMNGRGDVGSYAAPVDEPVFGRRGLTGPAALSDGLEEVASRGQGASASNPETTPRDEMGKSVDVAGPSPACWLCSDLGGIAVHIKASAIIGREIWVAHTLKSDSHAVFDCPACTLRQLVRRVIGCLGDDGLPLVRGAEDGRHVPAMKGANPS